MASPTSSWWYQGPGFVCPDALPYSVVTVLVCTQLGTRLEGCPASVHIMDRFGHNSVSNYSFPTRKAGSRLTSHMVSSLPHTESSAPCDIQSLSWALSGDAVTGQPICVAESYPSRSLYGLQDHFQVFLALYPMLASLLMLASMGLGPYQTPPPLLTSSILTWPSIASLFSGAQVPGDPFCVWH